MTNIDNLLAGNVHAMHTQETSNPRMLVINHTSQQAWVNVTLGCNTCPSCQKRIPLAEGKELFEVRNGTLDGHLWCEVPYPAMGMTKHVVEAIFTVMRVESIARGVLMHAKLVDECVEFIP